MARKLTPDELRAARSADFAPPVDPGQTELFGTQKVTPAAAKSKPKTGTKKKGRPRIHDTGKQISVWLEEDEIRRLRFCAAESGDSVSEFCAKWIRAGLVHGTKNGGCP